VRRQPTIASGAFRKLTTAIQEAGRDPASVLTEVGVDPALVADQDARIPLDRLHALWEAVLAIVPGADGAMLGAERYSPGDYGLVGFVAMNSPTLGEALRQAVRFLGLWTDDPGVELREDGTLLVEYRTKFEDRLGVRFATEATHAEFLNAARLSTGQHIVPLEVRFEHIGPRDPAPHEAFFGCKVCFRADTTAMVFRQEDLALPLPKADAQLGEYLRSIAGQALAKRGGDDPSPLDRIRTLIAEELQRGVPGQEQVAKLLGMSERTLRRRLEEEGTSFREVLDETRAHLARSYVADQRIPLSEVAFLLGFSEPSAFHRAFKRWTGTTPSTFRAKT
jgi:AraC-like DNA-binding protein